MLNVESVVAQFGFQDAGHPEEPNKRDVDFFCAGMNWQRQARRAVAQAPLPAVSQRLRLAPRAGRLEARDTADWKSALLRHAGSLRYDTRARLPRPAVHWQRVQRAEASRGFAGVLQSCISSRGSPVVFCASLVKLTGLPHLRLRLSRCARLFLRFGSLRITPVSNCATTGRRHGIDLCSGAG